MMKKLCAHYRAAPLLTALVLGLLSGCPNMMGRSSHSAPSGEGLALIRLAAPEEAAFSARTATPPLSSFYFTLAFSAEGSLELTKELDQAASIEVRLRPGDWTLEARGYSDAARTNLLLQGEAGIHIVAGESSTVMVELSPPAAPSGTGSIDYEIRFPENTSAAELILNNYADGLPYITPINLLVDGSVNTYAVDNGIAAAAGTIASVPAGFYQALVKLSAPGGLHGGYTTLVHVYSNAVTPLTREFTANSFSENSMVDDLNLGGKLTAPLPGATPDTTPIDTAQYTGTILWKDNFGNDFSSPFNPGNQYRAIVSLVAKEGFSFAGVEANTFGYPGAETVTHAGGTGPSMSITIYFPPTPERGLRYVKENGTGNGSTWDYASGDLQRMIDEAGKDKAEDTTNSVTAIVRVAAGTYKSGYMPGADGKSMIPPAGRERDRAFMLRSGVAIRGGYPANALPGASETNRPGTSILSGDIDGIPDGGNPATGFTGMEGNAYHVVLGVDIPNDGTTILDGFVIRGGNANGSGEIVVGGHSISRQHGGGMYNCHSTLFLEELTIEMCSASGRGGGMHNLSSPLSLRNMNIRNNFAQYGGGLANHDSSPVLTNAVIRGNSAPNGSGGGIYNVGSSPVLTNGVIAGNSAANGGGIYNDSSAPALTNVTMAGNSATSGGGIYNRSSSPRIRNSIIWGNSGSFVNAVGGAPEISCSIVQGGWAGTLNMNIDPAFVDAANLSSAPTVSGDYHLSSASPAINMGDSGYYDPGETPNISGVITDLEGHNRVINVYIDLGAYEEPAGVTADCLRYVKENGAGGGSSWEDASGDLQSMVDQAGRARLRGAAVAAVRVAAGTYTPRHAPAADGSSVPSADLYANDLKVRDKTFILRPGVAILGGYPANATTSDSVRDWAAHRTILSGDLNGDDNGTSNKSDNAYHVVLGVDIPNDGTTVLDGFVIKGGVATGSGNLTINTGSGPRTITNSSGGGAYNESASPVLTNLIITGNSATSGGGMANSSSPVTLTNVTISENSAYDGGGMANSSSPVTLTNVAIEGNSATNYGGGIYSSSSSSLVLTNVIVAGNAATHDGGGMYNDNSPAVLTNVTVAGNSGGFYVLSASSLTVRNSIIWGNSGGLSFTTDIYYSIFKFIDAGFPAGVRDNDMHIDPVFVLPIDYEEAPTTGGNYRLRSTSPAINMGNGAYYDQSQLPDLSAITTDLDGEPRVTGGYIDLGAYEEPGGTTQGRRYARAGGLGLGGGSSWTDASGDLQAMIDQAYRAKQRGATEAIVRVAAGLYIPEYVPAPDGSSVTDFMTYFLTSRDKTFILRPGVEIRGGYIAEGEDIDEPARKARFNAAGEPTEELYRAILSGDLDGNDTESGIVGDNSYHVVLGVDIPDDGTTILDGLTITGGSANGSGSISVEMGNGIRSIDRTSGGGISNSYSSPVLAKVTIAGNSATNRGGGIYNYFSSPVLANVTIAGNSASNNGGGMYNRYYSSPVLANVTIAGNSASTSGGGICNENSSPVLANVTIAGNSAISGGGIYIFDNSSPALTNVVITGNSASGGNGGGVNSGDPSSSPVLTNVTIAGNSAVDDGGIYCYGSQLKIRNSIIWGNSQLLDYTGVPEINRSLSEGFAQSGWTGTGSNNLDIDPVFASPQAHSGAPTTEGDYRLTAHSPAINGGSYALYPDSWEKWQTLISPTTLSEPRYNSYVLPALAKDAGGGDRVRPSAGAIDMGAYEEPGGISAGLPGITMTIADQGEGAFSQGTFALNKDGDPQPRTITIAVTGTGYGEPRWFVDGVEKEPGNSITIDAADHRTGTHALSLWALQDGKRWSKELDFTVGD
jgi:hypothetical protein